MKIAVPTEVRDDEPRVAATPETVKKLIALGAKVVVQAGAGARSHIPDAQFADAGAEIAPDAAGCVADADVVLKVRRPTGAEIATYRKDAVLLAQMDPWRDRETVEACAKAGLSTFSMEFIPRITRAQSMDVLSSQANLAGYKAVIDAASLFTKAMPMMMTAAGTIAPAKVFVMGAGVAGLQAIATARRLGAVVTATDVRPAAKEQVESLGGKFIAVEDEEFKQAETAGGYAKEMSDAYKKKQADLVAEHIKKQDIVITTALIPGRPAPVLVSEEMVKTMRPGAIIVDLAVEQGGNCPLSEPGQIVEKHGVRLVGTLNLPGRLSTDASALYARNLVAFLTPMIDKESGALKVDREDEIIKATLLTAGGAVVHPALTGSK